MGPRFALIAVALLLASASAAHAQNALGVRADCTAAINAPALAFDDQTHRRWYNRFWTGSCAGLFGCMGGNPNWNALVSRLDQEANPAQRNQVHFKACQVGHLVGHEWARDNGVRRIDTAALRAFIRVLEGDGDPMTRLETIERRAREMLSR